MIRGILLAAGNSSRFGSNKLLHRLPDGISVAARAARNLVTVLPDSIAVIRAGDAELARELAAQGVDVVECARAGDGMSASIACGIRATPGAGGWIVALADMPWIRPDTIKSLVQALQSRAAIAAPEYAGRRGHPVAFARVWRSQLLALSGDQGARKLLETHWDRLVSVAVDDAGVVADIDSPKDLDRYTACP